MLPLRIDPHSGLPVYRQIRDQILHMMAADLLMPGDKLPSIRELATQLTINPATVSKAYAELESAGSVVSQQGKGVFVASGVNRFSAAERKKILKEMLKQVRVEAMHLNVSAEDVRTWFEEELQEMNDDTTRLGLTDRGYRNKKSEQGLRR